MRLFDIENIKEQWCCKFLQNFFDKMYMVELCSCDCAEYTVGDLFIQGIQKYNSWLISFSGQMHKKDSTEFIMQMDLKKVIFWLNEKRGCYTVYYRTIEEGCTHEYQFNISYFDETRTMIVIMRQELVQDALKLLKIRDELLHHKHIFQFLIDEMIESFVEVKVQTGECRVFYAQNRIQECTVYKEQISWWAENSIVPNEREAYRKEFELSTLMSSLYDHDGQHNAIYTALYGDEKHSLSIVSKLVQGPYGDTEEYIFSYVKDITYIKDQEMRNKQLLDISWQLLNLSQIEAVTGLYNRAAGEKLIENQLLNSVDKIIGTMLFIDIDYFKSFNDRYGHEIGDFVLKFLGKVLKGVFRSDDILCRWGGDEFVVFMPLVYKKNYIESRIERLRIQMRQCKEADMTLAVTISIGGSIARQGISLRTLLAQSDKALYQVKAQGRDDFYIDFS